MFETCSLSRTAAVKRLEMATPEQLIQNHSTKSCNAARLKDAGAHSAAGQHQEAVESNAVFEPLCSRKAFFTVTLNSHRCNYLM
jgi:hypothetical protein